MAAVTIEDLILQDDTRGISALRPFLAPDYCTRAARFVLDRPGTTLIATGFYIVSGGAVETDGPPGALAIGRALEALGRRAVYVTDRYCAPLMRGLAGAGAEVVEFPIAGASESEEFARSLLARLEPALLVAIERCSASADGIPRSMHGVDISPYTAKVEALFELSEETVGIGDGGNEIGMGGLADRIAAAPKLPSEPAAVACAHLVIASVSNWGAYGLTAALSRLAGRDLLPSVAEEADWVRRCVELGAVDGFSGEAKAYVDGFPLREYGRTLERLRELIGADGSLESQP